MNLLILKESGYEEALLGLSLSFGVSFERAQKVSKSLSAKDYGHNKFLESIYMWLDITAPRYWWQEADTYRVGESKQSESTIHTITHQSLIQQNFNRTLPLNYLKYLNKLIVEYDQTNDKDTFLELKNALPEGFLQRRIWCLNYKTLRNIIIQRKNHKLPEWQEFCSFLLENAERKEYLEV